METEHLRRHLRDLRRRLPFLRPLRPESPAYRLWLGDVIELVNVTWGLSSPAMQQISDLLRRLGPTHAAAGDDAAARIYLQRLDALDAILAGFERELDRDGR